MTRFIKLDSRENYNKNCREYRVEFLGLFQWYPVIYKEQVALGERPLWLKLVQWWIQTWCKHKYEKVGREYIRGYFIGDSTTLYQNYKCKLCAKEVVSSRVEYDYP